MKRKDNGVAKEEVDVEVEDRKAEDDGKTVEKEEETEEKEGPKRNHKEVRQKRFHPQMPRYRSEKITVPKMRACIALKRIAAQILVRSNINIRPHVISKQAEK